MRSKKYNKKVLNKKNKSKKNKLKKTNKFKKNKSKRLNKNKSKKSKKIIKQIGGEPETNYIISASHGMIFRDTSDMDEVSKNPIIEIENSMNLIIYADFCKQACSTVKTIEKFICNPSTFVGAFDQAHKKYGSGSIIPEIYLMGFKGNDNLKITKCGTDEPIFHDANLNKFIKLSELIEKIKTDISNNNIKNNIDIHFIPCLEVYDISKLSDISININDITPDEFFSKLKKNNVKISNMLLLNEDCSEDILKIKRSRSKKLTPNTIKGVIDISNIKTILELKFQDNIKSITRNEKGKEIRTDDKLIYPTIIRQLNNVFTAYNHPSNIEFKKWLKNTFNVKYDDTKINEATSINDLIFKIANSIIIDSFDESLYDEILNKIPPVIHTNNTIKIDMSNIDISDEHNARIIRKYLFKILNNKINPPIDDTAINEGIEQAKKEAKETQEKAKKALERLQEQYS